MKKLLFLFIINMNNSNITIVSSCNSQSNLSIVAHYLQAKQKLMQENATKEDVETILDFYSDTLSYEHVLSSEKKFIFHGKNDLGSGYTSHLGETRNVKIELLNSIERQNIIVAEYSIKREFTSSGKIENSKIVSLFEFDRSGKIKRMIDYL
ncbi:MAG: hypothetical protein ABI834_08715 [Ginsengibacter sp.]